MLNAFLGIRPALAFVLVFALSYAALALGYSDDRSIRGLFQAGESAPIFEAALALAALPAASILLAFFFSQGSERSYDGLVWSSTLFLPWPIIMLLLPGDPGLLSVSWGIIGAQFAGVYFQKDAAWRYANAKQGSTET